NEELEEERRLAYVGITRAEKKLYLTCARTRLLYGKTNSHAPSRFLEEIPRELKDAVESASGGRPGSYGGYSSRLAGGGAANRSYSPSGGGNSGYGTGIGARPTVAGGSRG